MGGDHHHFKFPKMPDWRSYKVENYPELVRIERALASQGLKDPWLRNEAWRFDEKIWGPHKGRLSIFLFRGFKWGLIAALATYGIERALTPSHEGHDEHGHH